MKVMKFGGTSVGSVNSILTIKKIVESAEEPVIVVVSAVGGVTDLLIKTSKLAAVGNLDYLEEFRIIREKHFELLKDLFKGDRLESVQRGVNQMFDELANIFKGVSLILDFSEKTSNAIVSYGERLSSYIISEFLNAKHFDARKYIKTDDNFGKNILNYELTSKKILEEFIELPDVSVMGGFISSSALTGEITNLGRGGSDYTSAIMAAVLDASILEIWTDVDGFMTADPRVIDNAYVIKRLSYVEAMELSNFGAKVIYPPTIFPVYHKNIPIQIKNTFNPQAPGTYISNDKDRTEGRSIKGISSISDTSLITIQGLGMVGVIGVNYRIFKALAKAGISVFLVSQASSENTTSIGVRSADSEESVRVLQREFKSEMNWVESTRFFPKMIWQPLPSSVKI